MPDVVTLGPLPFPLERLPRRGANVGVPCGLAVAGSKGGPASDVHAVGGTWHRDRDRSGELHRIALGGVSTRPATVVYLWQGGFDPVAGIIAAALVIVVGLQSLRKGSASMLVFATASGPWIDYFQPEAQRPRPPFLEGIRLTDLDGRPVSLDDLAGFLERDLGIDAERERTSLAR